MQHKQKLSDWQRLECVIEWADMTINYFARHIGLNRGENLYQIKRGNNGISQKTAMMIVEKFPAVNLLWLLTGDGEMLSGVEYSSGAKPLYNVGVEENIRNVNSLEADEQLILPSTIDFDFAMIYLGRAMGTTTPQNSIILLKKILPEMIIPGDECVIVSKKIVLLRIVNLCMEDNDHSQLRLAAMGGELFGDVVVDFEDIEAVYSVRGKILTNR
ncbi:MAG: hypothetical protein SNG38_05920 [Rikenellaceae bacterium]